MPRGLFFLILLVAIIVAALFFLSGQAEEVPTRPIETEVNVPDDAR